MATALREETNSQSSPNKVWHEIRYTAAFGNMAATAGMDQYGKDRAAKANNGGKKDRMLARLAESSIGPDEKMFQNFRTLAVVHTTRIDTSNRRSVAPAVWLGIDVRELKLLNTGNAPDMSDTIDSGLKDQLADFREDFQKLRDEVSKRIVGQQPVVDGVLTALIAGGHVLLEGVPGLGKTLLVRTLSEVLEAPFSRIQFTPDLMPADLIGTNILVENDAGTKEFQFQRGPIFANVVLADEINRATPKTQSALLEAMQEHSVTVAGTSHQLDGLFFVLATQNPLEMEGTYPLPEAQLDRFLMKLLVPFPTTEEMETIMDRTTAGEIPPPEQIMTAERVTQLRNLSRQIPLADEVRRYAIMMVMGTHPDHEAATPMVKQFVRYGSSPRGAQSLILCAKIRAVLDGRFHVAKDDIREMAMPTLRHRVMLNFEGQAEGVQVDAVVEDLLENVGQAAFA